MNTAARRRHVRRLLLKHEIPSQSDLVKLLKSEGYDVTQATASRDLQALGAIKIRKGEAVIYAMPDRGSTGGPGFDDVAKSLETFVSAIVPSGNLVVLHTGDGAAHVVAAAIDAAPFDTIVGTIAGDNTLLIIVEDTSSGKILAKQLEKIGAQ
jgi:transcriptional regulator of arginine metabolism